MAFLDEFLSFGYALGMIFGPSIGFYFQWRVIREKQSLGSFSIDVCGILIFANILRIYFWFCEKFTVVLLFQSIVMIGIQFLLLQDCIRYKIKSNSGDEKGLTLQSIKHFWRWDNFICYVQISALWSLIFGIATGYCYDNIVYAQSLGFASVIIEVWVSVPQLLLNYKKKSTEGLSKMMITTWFAGDMGKLIYYAMGSAPIQFILCTVVQATVDLTIIYQIFKYSGNRISQAGQNKDEEQGIALKLLDHEHSYDRKIRRSSKEKLASQTHAIPIIQ